MPEPEPPRTDPEAWGVQRSYELGRETRTAPEATVVKVLEVMGADAAAPPPSPVEFVRSGRARVVPGAVEVLTEDGRTVPAPAGRLPADLPCGYHRLVQRNDSMRALVVSPGRCWLPPELRSWGWTVQLHALRSRTSWGIGDLADLGRLVHWARGLGAAMTLLNPLHAPSPTYPQQPSPYFPTSRCWRNPLFLRIEDIPGAEHAGLDDLVVAGRALNAERHIDRDAVARLKLNALERLWERFSGDPSFDRFRARHDPMLEAFAAYCALAETFGPDWRRWPASYRQPQSGGVRRFVAARRGRVRFFAWLQWLLDRQLESSSREGGVVCDLAVGSDPGGADAWLWQDLVADGVRVGAPPDLFNARGQDWGVAAFDPWRLRAASYEPLVRMLRMGLVRNGGLRIDHVMGLWRLFWIPPGASPTDGVYVRYPAREMLDIVALESERAHAYVIGEDLGTVERGVRRQLAARRMLSYRLLWFEEHDPAGFPPASLAAVTNHDLPTVAGMWSGADLEAQRAMGLEPDEEAHASMRRRVARRAGVALEASAAQANWAVYRLLARARSALLGAMLEDALGVVERHNHPGTLDEWPNWRLALPLPLEDIERDERVLDLARLLSR